MQLTPDNAAAVWARALGTLSGMVVEQAKQFSHVELTSPSRLVVFIKPEYAFAKASCQRPEHVSRFEAALAELTGQQIRVEFTVDERESGESDSTGQPGRRASPHQRRLEAMKHPMVQRANELFGSMQIDVSDRP